MNRFSFFPQINATRRVLLKTQFQKGLSSPMDIWTCMETFHFSVGHDDWVTGI